MSASNQDNNEPCAISSATRREVLEGSLAVAGSLIASSVAPSVLFAEPNAKRPNLVFFLGEGQRADALQLPATRS